MLIEKSYAVFIVGKCECVCVVCVVVVCKAVEGG